MNTDDTMNNNARASDSGSQPNPILMVLMLVWVLCLIGVVFGWYKWKQHYQSRVETETIEAEIRHAAAVAALADRDDDGRQVKSLKLIPQKDGSLVAQEVTPEENDKPWDQNGIEDFAFTDTDGHAFTKQDLLGKPFVISFIFTFCIGPCPTVTKEMRELQDRMKDYDFNLVSLTVDPRRDTTEVLKDYAAQNGADTSRWKFLTGEPADIYGLIHRGFLVPVEEANNQDRNSNYQVIHSTNIMLVDKGGRVIGKFNAMKGEEMAQLRKELKRIAPLKSSTTNNSGG